MGQLRDYRIFISHAWDYNQQYQTVINWLETAPNFIFTNYSVPITKPLDVAGNRELKQRLRTRISLCNSIIVLSGMYVTHSKWIDFEIDTAVNYRKPIIGVVPWGHERIPEKVSIHASTMVRWNSTSIVDAVRQYSL